MMKCVSHFVAILAAVIIIVAKEFVAQLPASPCRSIFTYKTKNDTGEAYGYLRFCNDLSGDYQLEIRMSVSKKTRRNIVILRTPTEDDILAGKDLEYEVYFPCQDIIPTLIYVKYNRKIYFTGTPARGSHPSDTTQLQEFDAMVTAITQTCNMRHIPDGHISTNYMTNKNISRLSAPSPKSKGCGILEESTVGKREHYPWLAAIYYPDRTTKNNKTYICSGTLISNSHIVTVAHCVPSRLGKSNITIRLGRNNIKTALISSSQNILRNVKTISIHPAYDASKRGNDIALVEFTEPVEFDDLISPICLWTGSFELADVISEQGSVIGWGPDAKPKKYLMPITSQENCIRSHPAFITLLEKTSFCAGNRDGVVPCNGNSGGPLMLKKEDGRYYLRGMLSAAIQKQDRNCDGFQYNVFTDVPQFGSWIQSLIDPSNSSKLVERI